MAADSSERPTYEATLVERLRMEANDVKECFTRFCFQAIGLSGVMLVAIARYQAGEPAVGLASIAVIIVLLSVTRIGTHKYATANRHFGYELHLDRTHQLPDDPEGGWNASMRSVGWEEAMKAWRVVQATVFRELYGDNENTLRKKHRKSVATAQCGWFEPRRLTDEGGAAYHSGSYLKTMFQFLNYITAIAFVPLFIFALQLAYDPKITILADVPTAIRALGFLLFAVVLGWTVRRVRRTSERRELLEVGLLSIHSCAIMWQAVVVAHYRALARLKKRPPGGGAGYRGYMYYLSGEAIDLAKHVFYIHDWIRAGGVAEKTRRLDLTLKTLSRYKTVPMKELQAHVLPGHNINDDREQMRQLATELLSRSQLEIRDDPQTCQLTLDQKLLEGTDVFDNTPVGSTRGREDRRQDSDRRKQARSILGELERRNGLDRRIGEQERRVAEDGAPDNRVPMPP